MPARLLRAFHDEGYSLATPVVVALSGGGDSVSLAGALEATGCTSVEYVWVDHSLRGEAASAGEGRVVERLAKRTGRTLTRRKIAPGEVREAAERSGQSIEHAARYVRYRELLDAARAVRRRHGAPVLVVTAHHREDQAENALLRIAGGHSPLEEIAIPRTRELDPGPPPITVFRPALGIPQEHLREWGRLNGFSWVEDESNRDRAFRRNVIRHTVLPPLEDSIPGAAGALARFAESVSRSRAALAALIPAGAWGVVAGEPPTAWELDLRILLSLPEAAREIVLREAVYRVASTERAGGGTIREVLRRLPPWRGPGAGEGKPPPENGEPTIIVDAPGQGVSISVSAGVIRVGRDIVPEGQSGYLFTVYDGLAVGLDGNTGRPVSPDGTAGVVIVFEAVSRRAVLRDRRIGDEIVMAEKPRAASDAGLRAGARPGHAGWPAVVEDDVGVAVFIWKDAVALRDGGPWQIDREDDPLQGITTVRIRG